MPQIWRLHAKSDAQDGVDPSSFCLDRHVAGFGWPVLHDEEHLSWDDYLRRGQEAYTGKDRNGWWAAINALRIRMSNGDLCWTRSSAGKYHLGRIVGEWEYRNAREYKSADVVNVRECEWVEIGDAYEVPGAVLNSFRARRTLQRIAVEGIEDFSMFRFNALANEPKYQIRRRNCDLFSLLGPEDCEDIVGVFLQMNGYILFPGTCKTDTKQFEFLLKNRTTGRHAAVQVKQGRKIICISEYNQFDGDVFLFQTSGLYVGARPSNVNCLAACDIQQFCLDFGAWQE